VKDLFGKSYRKRPVSFVIKEILSAYKFTRNIYFVDNNFAGKTDNNLKETRDLLRLIIKENLSIKASAFVTIDIAKNSELLFLMKSAGIKLLMIGFESIDRRSLEIYHKNQTPSEMEKNIKILKKDFIILGSFMAGMNGEDEYSISHTVSLAMKWGIDQLYYFVLSPYPSMREIVDANRVFLTNWDYGTGTHIYFFPKNIPPSKLQNSIIVANKSFYSYRRIFSSIITFKWKRGLNLFLRRILFNEIFNLLKNEYIPFLEDLEMEYYEQDKLNMRVLNEKTITKMSYWDKF